MGAETVDWAGRDIYMPPPVLQENKQKELRQQQKKPQSRSEIENLKCMERKTANAFAVLT